MNFNDITDTELFIYEIEFIFGFLFFIFLMQIKREFERIEEEEIIRMLKKKYEKGDR
jgi:hypothetical protein